MAGDIGMAEQLTMRAWSGTHVGQTRKSNEDSHYLGESVFAVADGMGGHQAGEVASEAALRPIQALDGTTYATGEEATAALVEAIKAANADVVEQAASDITKRGMGTTLTSVLFRDGRLHIAHVGDSRAYLLRRGELTQLTEDHTLVEQLVQEGRLSRDEIRTHPQRSVITRAIGVEHNVDVDTLIEELMPGDQIMLCSDGLSGPVKDEQIADILTTQSDGQAAVDALLQAANDGGGPDNITVVLLRVDGEPPPVTPPPLPPVPDEATTATRDLSDGQVATEDEPGQPVTQIRTREETGRDWAEAFGRYGTPQGADHTPSERRRRWPRLVAGLVGVVVLLGLLGVGGWFLLSRAYFVGDDGGRVAIFSGLNSEIAGVPLYSIEERTSVAVEDLRPDLRRQLEEGIPVGTLGEGRRLVERWRDEIEADEESPTTPSNGPSPTPADTG